MALNEKKQYEVSLPKAVWISPFQENPPATQKRPHSAPPTDSFTSQPDKMENLSHHNVLQLIETLKKSSKQDDPKLKLALLQALNGVCTLREDKTEQKQSKIGSISKPKDDHQKRVQNSRMTNRRKLAWLSDESHKPDDLSNTTLSFTDVLGYRDNRDSAQYYSNETTSTPAHQALGSRLYNENDEDYISPNEVQKYVQQVMSKTNQCTNKTNKFIAKNTKVLPKSYPITKVELHDHSERIKRVAQRRIACYSAPTLQRRENHEHLMQRLANQKYSFEPEIKDYDNEKNSDEIDIINIDMYPLAKFSNLIHKPRQSSVGIKDGKKSTNKNHVNLQEEDHICNIIKEDDTEGSHMNTQRVDGDSISIHVNSPEGHIGSPFNSNDVIANYSNTFGSDGHIYIKGDDVDADRTYIDDDEILTNNMYLENAIEKLKTRRVSFNDENDYCPSNKYVDDDDGVSEIAVNEVGVKNAVRGPGTFYNPHLYEHTLLSQPTDNHQQQLYDLKVEENIPLEKNINDEEDQEKNSVDNALVKKNSFSKTEDENLCRDSDVNTAEEISLSNGKIRSEITSDKPTSSIIHRCSHETLNTDDIVNSSSSNQINYQLDTTHTNQNRRPKSRPKTANKPKKKKSKEKLNSSSSTSTCGTTSEETINNKETLIQTQQDLDIQDEKNSSVGSQRNKIPRTPSSKKKRPVSSSKKKRPTSKRSSKEGDESTDNMCTDSSLIIESSLETDELNKNIDRHTAVEEKKRKRMQEAERRRLEVERKREEKRRKELEISKKNEEIRLALEKERIESEALAAELQKFEEEKKRKEEEIRKYKEQQELEMREEEKRAAEQAIAKEKAELAKLNAERLLREKLIRDSEIKVKLLRDEKDKQYQLERREAERLEAERRRDLAEEEKRERAEALKREVKQKEYEEEMRQSMILIEKRRREALIKRQKNLESRKVLNSSKRNQMVTRPIIFSYFVQVPRQVWELPIGWQKRPQYKTGGRRIKSS